MNTKKCVICGKIFKPKTHNQKTCSAKCKLKRHEQQNKKTRAEKVKPKRKRNRESELAKINRLAKESGMTYGQYMAEQYKKARNENGKINKQRQRNTDNS